MHVKNLSSFPSGTEVVTISILVLVSGGSSYFAGSGWGIFEGGSGAEGVVDVDEEVYDVWIGVVPFLLDDYLLGS